MKKFTAYRIYCVVTKKSYIGMTTKPLKRRISLHAHVGLTDDRPLYQDVRELGWGSFTITELATCTSYESAQELERILIAQYNTLYPQGYNLETGGNHGKQASEFLKSKLSIAHIGIPQSEKTIAKRSASMQKAYEEANGYLRDLRSAQFLGISKTEEHKRKIGAGNSGKVRSEELKAHLAIKSKEFAKLRAKWVAETGYTGPLSAVTKAMMQLEKSNG